MRSGTGRKRGPPKRNDAATAYVLKMPAALDGLVRAAAKAEGLSLAEWWRSAAVERLRGTARSLPQK